MVWVYQLKLSDAGKKWAKEEKEAITKGAEASHPLMSKEECIAISNNTTSYMVIPPECPPHLYLTPVYCAGQGNHLIVLWAKLELPRPLLMGKLMWCLCDCEGIGDDQIKENPDHANIHKRPLHIYLEMSGGVPQGVWTSTPTLTLEKPLPLGRVRVCRGKGVFRGNAMVLQAIMIFIGLQWYNSHLVWC